MPGAAFAARMAGPGAALGAMLALTLLAAVVYGPHVRDGDLTSDDWSHADRYVHLPGSGYGRLAEAIQSTLGARPLLARLLPVSYALFGVEDRAPHLALAVGLGVLAAVCAFAFLVTAGLARPHALAVAALLLLFPWDSSTTLWVTAAVNEVATCLVLLGGVAALHGLRRGGRSGAVLHAIAVLAYVLSVLVYEAAAPVVLVAGLLYAVLAGWRRALPRWGADVAAMGLTLAWVSANTNKYRVEPADALGWIPEVGREGLSLIARATVQVPLSGYLPEVAVAALAALVAVAAVVVRRAAPDDPVARRLRYWLAVAAGAAVACAAAWAMMVLSVFSKPLDPGIYNRTNIAAALPVVLLAYALAMIAVLLATRAVRAGPRARAVTAAVVAVLLVASYAVKVRAEADRWDRAAAEVQRVLTAVDRLPTLPPETTLYTFGHAAQSAPGVPVFFDTWDLNGAARLAAGDATLRAYPAYAGARFTCGARQVSAVLPVPHGRLDTGGSQTSTGDRLFGPDPGAAYGRAAFLDVTTGRWARITDRETCLQAVPRFTPGPIQLPPA